MRGSLRCKPAAALAYGCLCMQLQAYWLQNFITITSHVPFFAEIQPTDDKIPLLKIHAQPPPFRTTTGGGRRNNTSLSTAVRDGLRARWCKGGDNSSFRLCRTFLPRKGNSLSPSRFN